MPVFFKETWAYARAHRLWVLAYFAVLLMPLMLIVARAGMEICGGIIGLSFLAHSAKTRDWGWLRDPFLPICCLIWLWLVLVVSPFAVKPSASWMEAIMWFRLPLMLLALRYWVLTLPAARTTLAALIGFILMLIALDSLFQLLIGISISGHMRMPNGRLTGPFETPKVGLYMGKLGAPAVALALVAAIRAHSKRGVIASLLVLIITIATILVSGERSAFLCLLIACAVTAGMLMLHEKRWRVPCLLAGATALVLLVSVYFTSEWVRVRAAQSVGTITHYSESDYGLLAQVGIKVGREHWLHGVGLHGFRDFCPDIPYQHFLFRGMHPHNAYVEWFSEAGLPGLLLFLVMIVMLFRPPLQHWRAAHGLECVMPAAVLGILVQHFFPLMGMQSFFTNWAAMTLWFPIAIAYAALPVARRT